MGGEGGGRPRDRVTLRRPGFYIFSWVFVVLMLIVMIVVLVGTSTTLSNRLQLPAVGCVCVWFLWLLGIAQRIVVSDDGLLVVSWFVRWQIPWSAVAGVTAPGNLVIELTDGRRIAPGIAGDSVISALMRNSLQRRMLDVIVARRTAASSTTRGSVQRRIDLHPWLLVGLYLGSAVIAVVMGLFGR